MAGSERPSLDDPRGRAVVLYLAAAVLALGGGVAAVIVAIVLVKGAL
jgi:hypothetical protein